MEKINRYFKIPQNRRLIYDYIRVISCIGIVCLHTTGDRGDGVGVIFVTLSRISLPMFVLLSGALALGGDKEEGYCKYYWKRFTKIVIPYFIYTSLYVGYFYLGHSPLEIPSKNGLVTYFKLIPHSVKAGLENYQSVHLWFVTMIIGFYLIAPFLKKGLKSFSDNDLIAFFSRA